MMFRFLSEVASDTEAAKQVAEGIGGKVSTYLNEYIDKGVAFLQSQPWYIEAIIVLVVALLLIIGLFRFIKKIWKLVLILAILGVIGFAVYFFVIQKKQISDLTSMFGCINTLRFLL